MAAHFSNWKGWSAVAHKQLEERCAAFQRAADGMQGLKKHKLFEKLLQR